MIFQNIFDPGYYIRTVSSLRVQYTFFGKFLTGDTVQKITDNSRASDIVCKDISVTAVRLYRNRSAMFQDLHVRFLRNADCDIVPYHSLACQSFPVIYINDTFTTFSISAAGSIRGE